MHQSSVRTVAARCPKAGITPLVVVFAIACGSDEVVYLEPSPHEAADRFEPCGGDPTGVWSLMLLIYEGKDECSTTRAEFEPLASFLHFAAPHLDHVPGSYVATFGKGEPDGRVEKVVDKTCLDRETCAAHLVSDDEAPVCSEHGDSECSCTYFLAPVASIETAFWVAEDDTLSTTNSSAEPLQTAKYCVSEPYLVMRYDDDENDVWTWVAKQRGSGTPRALASR